MEQSVIFIEDNVGGRARLTTDEERLSEYYEDVEQR